MKRFVTTLLMGAALAVFAVSGARAEYFTITRLVSVPSISTPGANGISVNFPNPNPTTPTANSAWPGTSFTALNYTVTTFGAPVGNYTFNDAFTLTLVWDSAAPSALGSQYISVFDGMVTGFANATQDNVVVTLTPQPGALTPVLNGEQLTVFNQQKTLPPVINDTANPGAISYKVTGVIPEPGSMALLGTALLPVLGLARRRRN